MKKICVVEVFRANVLKGKIQKNSRVSVHPDPPKSLRLWCILRPVTITESFYAKWLKWSTTNTFFTSSEYQIDPSTIPPKIPNITRRTMQKCFETPRLAYTLYIIHE